MWHDNEKVQSSNIRHEYDKTLIYFIDMVEFIHLILAT